MRVLVFVLFLLVIHSNVALKNKKVNVVLKTKWPAYPLPSETSEFLGRLSNEAFWQFFEHLGVIPEGLTDKGAYEYLLSTASQQLSPVKLSLLKWSLSIHNDNPMIEMYRQLVEQEIFTLLPEEARKLVNCSSWVSSRGHVICSPDQQKLSDLIGGSGSDIQDYPFDHVYQPITTEGAPTVVLHGQIGESSTFQFHGILKKLLEKKPFKYIFRHYYSENLPRLNLQGYGVELALKSLEYKVIDDTKHVAEGSTEEVEHQTDELPVHGFDFNLLTKNYPSSSSDLLAFKAHLLSAELDLENLKVWELKDLGLVSAQNIISSPDPLRMLRDISQNLPILVHTLARQGISSSQRASIISTIDQLQTFGTTSNLIWINNSPYDASTLNPFTIYNSLSKQIVNYDILRSFNIKSEDIYKLLTLPVSKAAPIQINIYTELTDYINNLETDVRYQNWYGHVRDLLQPVWTGQFHYIKKNLYNLVLVVDPASMEGIQMTQIMSSLIWQNLPARIGFLFDIKDNTSELAVRLWKYIKITWGINRWFQFISQLLRLTHQKFSEEDLKKAFEEVIPGSYETAKEWKEHDIDNFISNTKLFTMEKGLSGLSPQVFLNGHILDITSTDFIEPLVSKIFELRSKLQEYIQTGMITDDTNIYEFVMTQEEVLGSFNRLILSSANNKPKYVPLYKANLLNNVSYLVHMDAEDMVQSISHLFAVNMDTQQGKHLVQLALDRLNEDNAKNVRIGFIDCGKSILLRAINSILKSNARTKVYLPLIRKLVTTEDLTESLINQLVEESSIKYNLFETTFGNSQEWLESLTKQHQFCTTDLVLGPTQNAIITSGRIITLSQETAFTLTDLALLERYEYSSRLKDIVQALEEVTYEQDPDLITSPFVSSVTEKLASLLALLPDRTTSKLVPPPIEPSFEVKSGSSTELTIVAILDPLSTAAQKASPVLISLVELFNCSLKVLLNPSRSLSNMPLKNFYRYQMDTIIFDENERLLPGGVASFLNLPQKRLLSTTISVPSSWLVLSSKCKYDLDNIVLDNLPAEESVLYAEFTLENILVEGSCLDISNIPPRGLELILGDIIDPHRQDSLVMSNLGYFQLKANPGVWKLALAPGRASTIYQIKSSVTQDIILSSFIGERELFYVQKRPGMESVSLFDDLDNDQEEGKVPIWQQLTGLFGGDTLPVGEGQKRETNATVEDDTIHIFSLASGHLYERFLKIMMLSVIENTKSPVKFWLLSNFLSPAFKDFVPKMAEKYKFQVEFVTYKWPVWLHEQTEKQRIIWGYKILFLDVLFPLSLKKVIYVDADQVVRVDLKELRDMNLKGAPYGYTPFCSGYNMNPDTTGFRFWDSGYWRDHLAGKPYHISALYVVDLHRLRERGYADQLRATYDGLSKDPNSLANLDQDLPNYLQHMVPIYTLPQEWLWCETWCTIGSKEKAKTIDLCNNPLTKVPKLEAAVRLIPEWQQWDSEIKQFEQSLDKNKIPEDKKISLDNEPEKNDL